MSTQPEPEIEITYGGFFYSAKVVQGDEILFKCFGVFTDEILAIKTCRRQWKAKRDFPKRVPIDD